MFPILYSFQEKKTLIWKIEVIDNDDNTADIVTSYGQENGKQVIKVVKISAGKNIGKINETTPFTQAVSEAKSKWEKKKEGGYVEKDSIIPSTTTTYIKPMLANKYDEDRFDLNGRKWYAQPKLDGNRMMCMKSDKIIFYSRQLLPFTNFKHLEQELINNFPGLLLLIAEGWVLDGEVYCHGIKLEEITGLSNKEMISDNDQKRIDQLQYWIYDMVNLKHPKMSYEERYDLLTEAFDGADETKEYKIKLLDCYEIENYEHALSLLDELIADGYEGVILRKKTSPYKTGGQTNRSNDLLKLKKMQESDYYLTDIKPAPGNPKRALLVCYDPEIKKKFNVLCAGNEEYNMYLINNKNKYIGKKIKIRYFSITDKNSVPRNATPKMTDDDLLIFAD